MFLAADHWLQQRLGNVVPKKQLRLGWPPARNSKQTQLFLQLIQVRPHGSTSIARRLPLLFSLDYLLIPAGGTIAKRHDVLGKAALVIAEDTSLSFSNDPLPGELLHIAHAWVPYLRIRAPWRHDRDANDVPVVTEVEVTRAPRGDVHGILLGPQGIPLKNEEVAIPALGRRAVSDNRGRIQFTDIPHKLGRTLQLHIRGRQWPVRTGKRPFTLHVTPKES